MKRLITFIILYVVCLALVSEETSFELLKTYRSNIINSVCNDIKVDGSGNVYILGTLKGRSVDLGGKELVDETFIPKMGYNCIGGYYTPAFAYIAKYSSRGKLIWAEFLHDKKTCSRPVFDVSSDGCVYYSGTYFTGKSAEYVNQQGSYIAKFDRKGKRTWLKDISGEGVCQIYDIQADGDEFLYAGGYYQYGDMTVVNTILYNEHNSNGFIMKLNKDGQINWTHQLGSDFDIGAINLAVNAGSDCFATVFCSGDSLYCDNQSFPIEKDYNQIAQKISADGKLLWTKTYGYVRPRTKGINKDLIQIDDAWSSICQIIATGSDTCYIYGKYKLHPMEEDKPDYLITYKNRIKVICMNGSAYNRIDEDFIPQGFFLATLIKDKDGKPIALGNQAHGHDFPRVGVRGGLNGEGYHYYAISESEAENNAKIKALNTLVVISATDTTKHYEVQFPPEIYSSYAKSNMMCIFGLDNYLYIAGMCYLPKFAPKGQDDDHNANAVFIARSKTKLNF